MESQIQEEVSKKSWKIFKGANKTGQSFFQESIDLRSIDWWQDFWEGIETWTKYGQELSLPVNKMRRM